MEGLFVSVVWLSATVSAVLLPLLLAHGWLRSRVRAKSLYILWLLLAVRLLIPVELTLPQPAVTIQVPTYQVLPEHRGSGELHELTPIEPGVYTFLAPEEGETPVRGDGGLPVTAVLGTLWLTGMLAVAVVQLSSYWMARRTLLRGSKPASFETEEEMRRLAQAVGLKRAFQVRQSGRVRTAMVMGVLRPVLILPQEGCDLLVVVHELYHLRRRDLEYKALLAAVCWVHWFNPLVWWMSRAAGQNLELCCDEDVAGREDAALRRRYGQLLLESAAEGPGPVLSSRFGSGKEELKVRLENLFVGKKSGRALICLALGGVLLVGGLVGCQKTAPDEKQLAALEESIFYDGQTLYFTIPEGEEEWELHIAGRADTAQLGGISLHYLEGTEWTPGETYSIALSQEEADQVTELTMEVQMGEEERQVDLLALLTQGGEP